MRIKVVQTSRNRTGHAGLVALGHCLNHFAPQVPHFAAQKGAY